MTGSRRIQKSGWERGYLKARRLIRRPRFAQIYVGFSLCTLLGTTIYWSLLSAKIQLGNSDQLINTDLFHNYATFRGATFPGAHTFLLKWPIFMLVNLFGSTAAAINTFTVLLVLLTVGGLVFCIYRIERRLLVFGTICLALASVLLMIAAQPYPGALLPLNMAMLTTRNIEYLVFILGLVLFIRSPQLKSWGFWLAALCLSFLFASDKLFLIFIIGGALIALILYAQTRAWQLAAIAVNWLIVGAVAAVGAALILAVISGSGLTHLTNQASANPYGLTSSPKQLALGGTYAAFGVLDNFGANPAFSANTLRAIPHQSSSQLISFSGVAYIVNFLIVAGGLFAIYKVMRSSWTKPKNIKRTTVDNPALLSLLLMWSSVAAILSFIVTNHYFAVDARYLTIVLFTVFITFAVYIRTKRVRPEILVGVGVVLCISIAFGLVGATRNYSDDRNALAPQNDRDALVAHVLTQHHANVLVGDYWRVVPTKQIADNKLNVMPLADCIHAQQALSSVTWQHDLKGTGFAYLLTLNGNLTNYPNCSLKQVVQTFGRPNASTLISGSLQKPNELILFYDRGINNSAPVSPQPPQGPATVVPISLSQLPYTTCPVPSITNIVAHQDDDLLFMNPDLYHEIKAGDCIRTIYLTAGDDGEGQFYWLKREQGSEAAYSYMLGIHSIWVQRIVQLANHEYVTIANPRGNAKISLIFMHLPDGNLKGQGFKSSNYESLAKLYAGKIPVINSVDHQSYYTSNELVQALSTLMNVYQTTGISTQAGYIGTQFPDHSDHLTVNKYVKQAYSQFETQQYANQVIIPIKFYIGYPGRQQPPNVSGSDLAIKEQTFLHYAKYDTHVCPTLEVCQDTPTYGGYLVRQYQNSY